MKFNSFEKGVKRAAGSLALGAFVLASGPAQEAEAQTYITESMSSERVSDKYQNVALGSNFEFEVEQENAIKGGIERAFEGIETELAVSCAQFPMKIYAFGHRSGENVSFQVNFMDKVYYLPELNFSMYTKDVMRTDREELKISDFELENKVASHLYSNLMDSADFVTTICDATTNE